MKAILLRSPGQFDSIDLDEPGQPGPGEALLAVHRVGICGTDIAAFRGKMPLLTYPRILGHELGVEVIEVGSGVENVRPGDRCSVEPYINCQNCSACRRGRGNCCESLAVLGVHVDGGLRPRMIVPARKLHASAQLSLEQLALVETLAIGCHAVDRGGPAAGEHALVVGVGPIGLATLPFVQLAGATITVLDINEQRLDFCRRTLGVEHVIPLRGDGSELARMHEITGSSLYNVVFDATGSAQSMSAALSYVAHAGRLVLVGITPDEVRIPDPLLHRREVTLYASRNALPNDFTRIIKLIEGGRIDTRPWITHRTTIDRLIDDFPSYTRPETGVIKAMVDVLP